MKHVPAELTRRSDGFVLQGEYHERRRNSLGVAVTIDIMETWLRGYCLARDMPDPEVVPEGFWIEVAKPQQAGRFILERFDPVAVTRLIDRITETAVYIEFPGSRGQTLPILPEGWSIKDDAWLMEQVLSSESRIHPAEVNGYVFVETRRPGGIEVEARTVRGALAAHGRYAGFNGKAVFDQITTEPAHERRGLGRAVVARLSVHALASGLRRALLVATEEGRGLYVTLGWTELSPIISIISHF